MASRWMIDEIDALGGGREELGAMVGVVWVLFGVDGFEVEFCQGVEGGDHFLAGGEIGLRHFLANLGGEGVVGIEVHGVLWGESKLDYGFGRRRISEFHTKAQRHKGEGEAIKRNGFGGVEKGGRRITTSRENCAEEKLC
jgi:hypothetical protein